MRIIILADPLDNQRAGIHYYTRELVSGIAGLDTDNEYLILRRKRDQIFPAEKQIIVKNYRFPGYAALRMFILIPLKIRKLKADVVVEPAHFGPFNLPRRTRRVTVMHDLTPIMYPKMHRFHSQLLQRIFLKGILKRASLIVTNSNNTSKDLLIYYPGSGSKTAMIHLGRDPLMKSVPDQSSVEKFTDGEPYFLYAGTIEPRKNLITLLKAYKSFRDRTKMSHKLVLAGGKGWKSNAFYKEVEKHDYRNDIVLTGYVKRDELSALYSHAEAFVFPSLYEGFGLPVLEAMSCGAACIVSRTSSLPEVGGDACLYFDPNKAEELAEHMKDIVGDKGLKGTLSQKALEQSAKFSWEMYATQFDNEITKRLR